ncbi:unnamed protein product, partial [Ostreobium quekettii]
VCGAAVAGLGVWNGTEVNWSPLSWIVCAFGIVVIAVSCLGILVSQGVTLCLHVGLWVYLVSEFILVVIEVVLLIAASVKKTEWIDDLTEKYADEKDLERFREEYDDFWPYIIAFGALTVVSSALGLLLAIRVKRQLAVERDDLEGIISDRRPEHVKAKRDEIKKPYKDMSVAMVEKYGDRFNSKNGPK